MRSQGKETVTNYSLTGKIVIGDNKKSLDDSQTISFQEAVLNQVTEGLCVFNKIEEFPFVRFTVWNEMMTKITGYQRDEVNDVGWYKVVSPESEDQTKAKIYMEKIIEGEKLNAQQIEITCKDGTSKTISISTSLLMRGENSNHIFAIMQDVTEKIAERKRREKLREQLARADKMESMGLLAGGVAHDLNNMLGPIVGYADLLLRQHRKDKTSSPKLEQILKSAQEAAEVVQDLLTLARRGRYELRPIALNRVLNDCLESPVFESLKQRYPEVKVSTDMCSESTVISGSLVHLKKALMNLIANAFDAMPLGGQLDISTSKKYMNKLVKGYPNIEATHYIVISVRDTGIGIEKEAIPKIFEPYFSKKAMGTSSGSGLGLSVVYGVLKDHNGYFDITSEIGKGTEFLLYFPVSEKETTIVKVSEVDIRGKETILVVDDQLEQRDLAKNMLEDLGYKVTTVENGRKAIEILKIEDFDLVLLDMIMEPGIDGLDTYREIRKIKPSQKTIIVSGFSESDRTKAAIGLGVKAYMKKPYTVDALGGEIRSIIDYPEQLETTKSS